MTDQYLYARRANKLAFNMNKAESAARQFSPVLGRSTRLMFLAYLVVPAIAVTALSLLILR